MQNKTIKDIAKTLGVSASTVSRALTDNKEISLKTKQKILEYTKAINYIPNPMAMSLRGKINKSIAIVVPTLHNSFFSEVIAGIDSIAHKKGYHIIIFQTQETYNREVEEVLQALGRRVDGIAISLSGQTDNFDHVIKLIDNKFPIVFFDRVPTFEGASRITVDNFRLAYECTQRMIDKGFKKFAHVATPLNLNNIRERHEGFVQCIKDNHLRFDKRLLKICNYDPLQAHKAVKSLIENFKVDAIFTSSDKITIDTCRALNDLMPNDHVITQFGFTNLSTADLISPPIISIKQPAFELGAITAEVLLHNIESPEYENWKTEDIKIN